jgi:hypothetical protein
MIVYSYAKKTLAPDYINALDSLKKHTNFDSWKVKDMDSFYDKSKTPYIVLYKYPVSPNAYPAEKFEFTNNNLEGKIPNSFTQKNKEFLYSWGYGKEFHFSWNKITEIGDEIHFTMSGYIGVLKLDHNNITKLNQLSVDNYRNKYGKYLSYNVGAGCNVLTLNNNELERLGPKELGSVYGHSYCLLGNGASLFRVENNRLDFEELIELESMAEFVTSYRGMGVPGNENFVFSYFPQKALGDKFDKRNENEGTDISLNFNLRHSKNIYTWQLNGKDIPLSAKKDFNFTLSSATAGVYRCKITNPDLPEVTLYSRDMQVYMNKSGNQSPSEVTIQHGAVSENYPALLIIGDFKAKDSDGDAVYFRLPDNRLNNSCFRIKDGKTLISSEILFEHPTITEYKILVEAYDVYGGITEKEITISKGEATAEPLPSGISISNNHASENVVNDTIGTFSTIGAIGYNFILDDGVKDNDFFEVVSDSILRVKTSFNFENRKEYSIRITAIKADMSLQKDFKIVVDDEFEAPSDIILAGEKISVGRPIGSVIGFLSAVDEDAVDEEFEFELVDGEFENHLFVLGGNKLKSKIEFIDGDIGQKKIKVKVKDPHNLEFSKELIINVEADVTQTKLIKFLSNRVGESQAIGSVISEFSIMNDNIANYSIELMNEFDYIYFKIEDKKLKLNREIDFETKETYKIKVKVKSASEELESVNYIYVDDNNEAPTTITMSNMVFSNQTPIGVEVSILSTTDQDLKDNHRYEVISNEFFRVEGNKLVVAKNISSLSGKNTIDIKSTDKGGLSSLNSFNLYLTNEDITNPFIKLDLVSLIEGVAEETVVASFSVENSSENWDYSLNTIDFKIVGDKIVSTIDLTKTLYSFELKATKGTEHLIKNVIISINKNNETPSDIGLDNSLLNKEWKEGQSIGRLYLKDIDGPSETFNLLTKNDNFYLEGDSLKLLKYTGEDSYLITIEASDGVETCTKDFELFFPIMGKQMLSDSLTGFGVDNFVLDDNWTKGQVVATIHSVSGAEFNGESNYLKVEGSKVILKSSVDKFQTVYPIEITASKGDIELKSEFRFFVPFKTDVTDLYVPEFNDLKAYPNPVVNKVKFNKGDRMEVYNPSGTKVFQSQIGVDGIVDLSSIVSGFYFVRVYSGDLLDVVRIYKR